jgi:nucleotide-binding universal stress UspA family protein
VNAVITELSSHEMNVMNYKIANILVAVDLSQSSLNALDTAVAIAVQHGAALHILYINERSYQNNDVIKLPSFQPRSQPTDVLYALGGAITYTYQIQPVFHEMEGNVPELILETAFTQRSDLIVMGKHGASGFRDDFIGSNTYQVIKHAHCPVLSVPNKKKVTSFNKILFPVRPVSRGLAAFEFVGCLSMPGATMDVLGLSYKQTDADTGILSTIVDEIREELKKSEVIAHVDWGIGFSIGDEVINYALNHNPDLVVVTTALDVTSKPKYIGPHTQKIINSIKVPVLSLKNVPVPAMAFG